MPDPLPPLVFISYAWGDDGHNARVLRLAENLRRDGVEVIFDRWDLEAGQDLNHFMERSVNDPQVSKVLVILDRKYTERANSRAGGVGAETLILGPDVYADPQQTRCIPLLFESANGQPVLPVYLKSRLYLDFSTDAAWEANWEPLLRQVLGARANKPPLGSLPAKLLEELGAQVKAQSQRTQPGLPVMAGGHHKFYQRLHEVLDWHDLDLVQAATLLKPFGFTSGVLTSSERTVDLLDESVLDFLIQYFQVDRAFLLGRDVGPGRHAGIWYKNVRPLCQRIVELHNAGSLEDVHFVTFEDSAILNPVKWRLRGHIDDVLIALVIKRRIGDIEKHSFELWESGDWLYEKSRLDLKAIALFCETAVEKRHFIALRGGTFDRKKFDAVNRRTTHLAEVIKEGFIGFGEKWHPTDYVSTAQHLLKDQAELSKVKSFYDRYGLSDFIEQLKEPEEQI